MATSGVEADAWRLLGAFYDLSGHSLLRPVQIGDPGASPDQSAAKAAGFVPGSPECDVALKYLLNGGYVKAAETPPGYGITVGGIDKVREMRGLDDSASSKGGIHLSDETQKRLLTVLAIGIAMILTRPVNRFIAEQIPERRGVKDDLTEAALQGVVRATAFFAASFIVRLLARSR